MRISFGDCNEGLHVLRNRIVGFTYPKYGNRRPTMKATINGIYGLGQVVLKSSINSTKSNITTSNLPKGIYFVKILLEDNTIQIKKLIIQ